MLFYQSVRASGQEYPGQTSGRVKFKIMSLNSLFLSIVPPSRLNQIWFLEALDRQHPRDLFDVKLLLEDTGIIPEIRRAFVVYLAGHSRPMHELLSPHLHDIREQYDKHFRGISGFEVSLKDLQYIQENLPQLLVESLDENEKMFLLSMKKGEPDWHLLGIKHGDKLPALQWRLINIRKMDSKK